MKQNETQLNSDFFYGENPDNLENINRFNEKNDFYEPLPHKYANRLPDYMRIFCNPYISTDGSVKFNIDLTKEFLNAIKIEYSLKNEPSREEICKIIESEIKKCLYDF